MKTLFKIALLMYISLTIAHSQTQTIYSQSYEIESETQLNLDLNNTYLEITKSYDGKLHIDYNVNFDNYSNKEIEEFIKEIKVISNKVNNQISLEADSEKKLSGHMFFFESNYGIVYKDNYTKEDYSNKTFTRKSKIDILTENNTKKGNIDQFLNKIKAVDKQGNESALNPKDIKTFKSNFKIKVPENVRLQINAVYSNLDLNDSFKNEIKLTSKNTRVSAMGLINPFQSFDITNSEFIVNHFDGGTITLSNVKKFQVAEIRNCLIKSEFSKIIVGEFSKDVTITDFESEFWFYNFNKDFKSLDITTSFSQINLFQPETDYELTTFGYETVHVINGVETYFDTEYGAPTKMLKMTNGKAPYKNKITIEAKHCALWVGKDEIKF